MEFHDKTVDGGNSIGSTESATQAAATGIAAP
jgi:hypothetical protein